MNETLAKMPAVKPVSENFESIHSLLEPDSIVGHTADDFDPYVCQICTQIIEEPVICEDRSCGYLLDRSCYDNFAQNLRAKGKPFDCPNCRGSSGYSKNVPPVIKKTLSNFSFKCKNPGCSVLFKV